MSLCDFLKRATAEHWAVGHFNVSELDQFRAVVAAAAAVRAPVMVGTSEGERAHLGLKEAVALRDAFRSEFGVHIYLNADHTRSVEAARAAIDAGYDSVHIDLSKLSLEENIRGTKEVVGYARSIGAALSVKRQAPISIEGEVGYLVTESSKIYKQVVEIPPESLTNPDDAERFVRETGVDRFAPAVGSIHGIAVNEPRLDFTRIADIRSRLPANVTLVLHGGSGIADEGIKRAIAIGIGNVHVSTELRVAYVNALRATLAEDLDEVATYKLDTAAMEALKKLVKEKLELFGSVNKMES